VAEEVNPDQKAAAEAAALEAAQAAKPKRKKGAAAVGAVPGPEAGAEGAAEVLEAAAAAAAGGGGGAATAAAGAIKFYSRLANEYIGFSNFASTPFTMEDEQSPRPDGSNYPEFTTTPGAAGAGARVGAGPTTWPTVEHYYQSMKFPDDPMWQEEIRRAATPARAKKMGLSRDHPLRGDWDTIKERVMKKALLAKFRQNPGLLSLLQKTGDKPLVEASPGDSYWGAGRTGKGQNRMGALLAEVRTELADVRVDEAMLAAADQRAAVEANTADLEADMESEPEDIAAAAVEMVNAAAAPGGAGTALLQGGGGGQPNVVMIINPQMGGAIERARNTRARSRGADRQLSWSGMSISREGADEITPQAGGSAGVAEEMTAESGNHVEVTVEKLE
jgi:ribA/ribD-fused uncharacterized protein